MIAEKESPGFIRGENVKKKMICCFKKEEGD